MQIQKWLRRTSGVQGIPKPSLEPVSIIIKCCGSYCRWWRESTMMQLAEATSCEISPIKIVKIGPSQYDVVFELYRRRNGHSIIENWFGTACCRSSAVARAYNDYYHDNIY